LWGSDADLAVIASAAKQSLSPHAKGWIASSLRSLAQRFAFVAGNDDRGKNTRLIDVNASAIIEL
jgi:hypothetical protein